MGIASHKLNTKRKCVAGRTAEVRTSIGIIIDSNTYIISGAYLRGWTNETEPPPEGKINK